MSDRDAVDVFRRPWGFQRQDNVSGVQRIHGDHSRSFVRIVNVNDQVGQNRETILEVGATNRAITAKFLVHHHDDFEGIGTQASTEQSRRNGVSGDFNVSARAVHATERAADGDIVIGGVRQLGVGDNQGGGCRRGIGSRIDRASSDFHPLIDQATAVRHDREADRATNDVRGVRGLGDNRRRGRSGTDDEVVDRIGTIGARATVVVGPDNIKIPASRPGAEVQVRRNRPSSRGDLGEFRKRSPAAYRSSEAVVGMVTADFRVFACENVRQAQVIGNWKRATDRATRRVLDGRHQNRVGVTCRPSHQEAARVPLSLSVTGRSSCAGNDLSGDDCDIIRSHCSIQGCDCRNAIPGPGNGKG